MSKKADTILEIYEICKKRKNFEFDNGLVKEISKKYGFGNPFDATKIDNIRKLPKGLIEDDIAIIHLGNGRHSFVRGINKLYHVFEPVHNIIDWEYNRSLLNEYNTSESNILSVANNQRILHHFSFGIDNEFEDLTIEKRPKTYFPHRTKTNFSYNYGNDFNIQMEKIQIEIDLTIEFDGIISVFEGKNGKPDNFAVYQIYHPFLYYHNANNDSTIKGKIKGIKCIYVIRSRENKTTKLKLWAYTFDNPFDITSIKFVNSTCYNLISKGN